MMTRGAVALVFAAGIACGDHAQRAGAPRAGPPDTGFARLQSRGESAMGVDQYTSAHRFEPLPDGGRIQLRRDTADRAGVETIRAHMRDIAGRFSRGDFTIPGFVHAGDVPGTRVMSERKAQIAYEARDLPGGGEVRIRTTDSAAVAAVHQFLAFQRSDHRAH
jgi:hypothetical protein